MGSPHALQWWPSKVQQEERLLFLPVKSLTNATVKSLPTESHYTWNSQFIRWALSLHYSSLVVFPLFKRVILCFWWGTCTWLTMVQFSLVQPLSRFQLFATSWTAARQASMSITSYQSLLKLMPIESVTPSNHLIHCCPLLLERSIFPSIRIISSESAFCIRWPKYQSFNNLATWCEELTH